MSYIKQALNTVLPAKQDPEVQRVCNFADNYYGDQVCHYVAASESAG